MQNFLSATSKFEIAKFCMKSFTIIVFLHSERDQNNFDYVTNRLSQEEHFKMIDVCRWLKSRNINYDLKFQYNKRYSIFWNFSKYKNFLRLKYRLKRLI